MDARHLQQSLVRVVERVRAIDVRHYEWREQSSLEQELLPAVSGALSDAIDVFTHIGKCYGSPRGGTGTSAGSDAAEPSSSGSHTRLMGGEDGTRRITDLAFMARWELYREREGLRKMSPSKEVRAIVSECSRACRQLIISAIAIEGAICAHEGLSTTLDALYRTELNRSLRVRQAYAAFRHTIAGSGHSTRENIRERLRAAAIGIAQLVASGIYGELRAADRMRIEALRSQLTERLGGSCEDDPLASLRLCQEIKNVAELLLEVNKRAELRKHDRAIAAEACVRLFHTESAPDRIPRDLQLRLRSLFGRDEELDRLIADPASHALPEWRGPLERILETPDPSA